MAKLSGERLQDHWSSGLFRSDKNYGCYGIYSSYRLIMGKENIDNFIGSTILVGERLQ